MKNRLVKIKRRGLKSLLLVALFMCTTSLLNAQELRTVSGVVTDETGFGTPGVNVIIKGSAFGTVTDLDG